MFTTINNFRCAFSDEGKGRTVLFVHGFPLSRAIWQPQIEALAPSHRVLAPDLRGHGESSATAGVYTMDVSRKNLIDIAKIFCYSKMQKRLDLNPW